METLFVLLTLVAVAIPVTFIWLVFSHIGLRAEVRTLRAEVDRLWHGGGAPARVPPEEPEDLLAGIGRPSRALAGTAVDGRAAREAASEAADGAGAPPRRDAPAAPPTPEDAAARDGAAADGASGEEPPKSYVFEPGTIARGIDWVRENWFLAVAALSLAMAGVFFVQYGIENGLLSPPYRVMAALGFGAALIAGGEWVRRRGGDHAGDATAFLPSTFAGAGIVTLFSAIVAARRLYALIGVETAFAGLVAVAALALLLGWVYGPFLSVVGILGAVAAPFVVGGEGQEIGWLFYYLALIAALGLGVDAMKRSAWVSAVALAVPSAGAALIWAGAASVHLLGFAALTAAAATCIPTLSTRPAFEGAMIFRPLHGAGAAGWPTFPTRLAGAGLLGLVAAAVAVSADGDDGFVLALGALTAGLAALAFWLDRDAVLDDLAVPFGGALLGVVALRGALAPYAWPSVEGFDMPGGAPTGWITPLTGFAVAVAAMLGAKALRAERFGAAWAAGSAVFAPLLVLILARFWNPVGELGEAGWAAHVMAVAAAMTVMADRMRRDGRPGDLRVSLFALAALLMIAYAMAVVLTESALTLGLAAMVAGAAWLDRRFDLWPVAWFAQGGVLVCGWRLTVDPGLPWALDAGVGALAVAYLGTAALLTAALLLMRARERVSAMVVTESAIAAILAIFASLLAHRAIDDGSLGAHWSMGLFGVVWLVAAMTQFHRVRIGGPLMLARLGLGIAFCLAALLPLGIAATLSNPLLGGTVIGPPVFDSLMFAYLLPAAILAGGAWRFGHLPDILRKAMGALALALATLYAGLEIRRLWQGRDLSVPGVTDGELYSYTIALLLTGGALLALALVRRSPALRKAALGVIGLTVAKVFLIDMAGLEGLIRVLSFLALGLALAGLALVNRWMTERMQTPPDPPQESAP